MRDVEPDGDDETAYECFDCGAIAREEAPPGECPVCGGSMRNRQTPME
ncbi:rubrerythrin-like domain-containing protein [Halorarius halobius]|nr:rubrerythrin-like domain-containing protein [Halorarius halobius]